MSLLVMFSPVQISERFCPPLCWVSVGWEKPLLWMNGLMFGVLWCLMVVRLAGIQQWGTAVSSVLRWILGFLLESSTADRLERTICEDKKSVSGLFSVCLPIREQWGLLFLMRWARSGRWSLVIERGYRGVWNQIQCLLRDLKWEYLEMVSKTGLETSLQHTYKSLAQETSYLQCKSKPIQEAGQETRDGGWCNWNVSSVRVEC